MTRRIQHCAKDEAGFSFAELMVVIAIIGILSATALPSLLGNLPEKRLKNAARNLYSDMQRGKLQAVKENRTRLPVMFETSSDGDFYYFDTDASQDFTAGEFRRNLYEYGDIRFGCTGVKYWNDNANTVPSSGISPDGSNLIFTRIGTAKSDKNENSDNIVMFISSNNVNACYAVEVTKFGAVKIRWQHKGGNWN